MGHFTKILGLTLISISILTNAALADAISVPEPSSMSLFAFGGIGLVLVARTLRSKRSTPRAA
ncbi:MAG TPA: PEP-CTERM sorting domain-containing protein [Gemmataceae bacterium]|jgi:hypothetical protein|nr:PEP-CTERM sorting domain-containing protein [Gemmataceae bacterium]